MVNQTPGKFLTLTGSLHVPPCRRSTLFSAATGALALLAVGAPAVSAADAHPRTAAANAHPRAAAAVPLDSQQDGFESAILSLTNSYRAENGLPPVSWNSELATAAQSWSSTMAANRTLSKRPDLDTQLSGPWTSLGETVAMNTSAEETVAGWTSSPAYQAVLLDPSFTAVGVGHAPSGTQQYVVQDFGGAAPASPSTAPPATGQPTTPPSPPPSEQAPAQPAPPPAAGTHPAPPAAASPSPAPATAPPAAASPLPSPPSAPAPGPRATTADTRDSSVQPGDSSASAAASGAGASSSGAGVANSPRPADASAAPAAPLAVTSSPSPHGGVFGTSEDPAALQHFSADLQQFGTVPNTVLLGLALLGVSAASAVAWVALRRKAARDRLLL